MSDSTRPPNQPPSLPPDESVHESDQSSAQSTSLDPHLDPPQALEPPSETFNSLGEDHAPPTLSRPLTFKEKLANVRVALAAKSKLLAERSFHRLKTSASKVDWVRLSTKIGRFTKNAGQGGAGTVALGLSILLCAYFLADLTALLVGKWIPNPPPARDSFMASGSFRRQKSVDQYSGIWSRNLFNSKGLIPGEDAQPGLSDPGGAPVRTTLPFALVGTLILQDELKSIATLEDKAASMIYPVRIDDEVPSKIRIIKVEPYKVVFLNLASGRREFVDLPHDGAPSLIAPKAATPGKPGGAVGAGIEKVNSTTFNVARTEVDKALADLNQVLTQARAIPNIENGQASGYKLFQIVPGSIYDKLGLQNGDVIKGLNGQPVNDPGKAFEMLNELKTSSFLELSVMREGKTSNFSYNIGSRP